MENQPQTSLQDQLIIAGLDELNEYGYPNFSVRRIAHKCGVSCAAPYKHFKDKQSFVAAIIKYVNAKWNERQEMILARTPSSTKKQILEVSLEYIRFLVENPYFRSVIMQKDEEFDKRYSKLRGQLSKLSAELVFRYCDEVNMPKEVRVRKTYVIRSLLYGAALMFDNGEMAYSPENMRIVAYSIDREFDLP